MTVEAHGYVPCSSLAGTTFAGIKETELASFWRRRSASGADHFLTLGTPGADQAAHMIATVPEILEGCPLRWISNSEATARLDRP